MALNVASTSILLMGTCFSATPKTQAVGTDTNIQLSEQIGAYLAGFHELNLFSGAALVAEGGEVVFRGAFGLANEDWGIPNSVETKFHLASVSKQFTAMLVLLLVEEGKLELDSPIVRYLPDYPVGNGQQVTLHHLLNHTSGIPNYTNRPGFMQVDALQKTTSQELIDQFSGEELEFEPGAFFHYSNSGYFLLAAIIESVTGASYAEVLRELILVPLGMTDTGHLDQSVVLHGRATGYHELLGQRQPARRVDMSNFTGAGSLYSTVGDLWKWSQALQSKQLLRGKLEELMVSPGKGDYGYGWFIDRGPGGELNYWHGGIVAGFSTRIHRAPGEGQSVILLSNTSSSSVQVALAGITEILAGRTPMPPTVSLEESMALLTLKAGVEAGLEALTTVSSFEDKRRIENGINVFGYRLLGAGRSSEAVELLKLNTRAFPRLANTWDSLGEAYLQVGMRKSAIASFRKALELDPTSVTANGMLVKLNALSAEDVPVAAPDPFEGWPKETFGLPPSFAPELPSGVESLRFTPGWRDPNSEQFWSYTFAMWIDETAPKTSRIQELLDAYFDGLMLTFAEGAGKDIGRDPAAVEVASISPGFFEAKLHLIDAFATFEAIDLRVVVRSVPATEGRTALRVQISPHAKGHAIWDSLESAVRSIKEPPY